MIHCEPISRALTACKTATGRLDPNEMEFVAIQEDNQNGVTIRDTAGSLRSDAPGTQPCGTLVGVPIPFTIHGEHSTAMTGGGVAQVAFETETARALDTTGGYATSQGGTVIGQPLAFSCKDHGADVGETAPTLRAMNFDGSHANAGGQVAVALPIPIDMRQASRGATMTNNRREDACSGGAPGTGIGEPGDPAPSISQSHPPAVAFTTKESGRDASIGVTPTLRAESGDPHMGGRMAIATPTMAVRRLLPVECEKLMGFSPGYTAVPFRGKPASDGPRYQALGNSMVVNELAWLGRRIATVEASA